MSLPHIGIFSLLLGISSGIFPPRCLNTLFWFIKVFNYLSHYQWILLADNVVRKVNLPKDLVASVSLWDCPGAEDMDMRDSYYRNVDAAIG